MGCFQLVPCMSFFSQMALLRLEFSLPDSAQRKTSVFSATHDNITWSINVTRGDAVINREIMVQTGGRSAGKSRRSHATLPTCGVRGPSTSLAALWTAPRSTVAQATVWHSSSLRAALLRPPPRTCVWWLYLFPHWNAVKMSANFAIVSASCPACAAFRECLGALHASGVRIIAVDSPLSDCVRDLLSALQVTSLPSLIIDGRLHSGLDAFDWVSTRYPALPLRPHIGTTVPDLLKIIATEHFDAAFAASTRGTLTTCKIDR
jgi:hypothetical protein